MNAIEIENKLRKVFTATSRYTRGATFLIVYARDRLPVNIPNSPCLLVVNSQDHTQPGEHRLAMYFDPANEYGEYFDSFGEPPPPSFAMYMLRHAKHIKCSDKQLQSVVSMFCGHYVVLYCAFRAIGYCIRKFTSIFGADYGLNDFLAHKMCCKLIVG